MGEGRLAAASGVRASPRTGEVRGSVDISHSGEGSDAEPLHLRLRIARAGSRARREGAVEGGKRFSRWLKLHSRHVLLQPAALLGAGQRHDEIAPRQQPGQRELRRCAVLLRGKRFQRLNHAEILVQVVALETRHVAAAVFWAERVEAWHRAGEEAAAERAIGDVADAEL